VRVGAIELSANAHYKGICKERDGLDKLS